jgi:hypothetical protein
MPYDGFTSSNYVGMQGGERNRYIKRLNQDVKKFRVNEYSNDINEFLSKSNLTFKNNGDHISIEVPDGSPNVDDFISKFKCLNSRHYGRIGGNPQVTHSNETFVLKVYHSKDPFYLCASKFI